MTKRWWATVRNDSGFSNVQPCVSEPNICFHSWGRASNYQTLGNECLQTAPCRSPAPAVRSPPRVLYISINQEVTKNKIRRGERVQAVNKQYISVFTSTLRSEWKNKPHETLIMNYSSWSTDKRSTVIQPLVCFPCSVLLWTRCLRGNDEIPPDAYWPSFTSEGQVIAIY